MKPAEYGGAAFRQRKKDAAEVRRREVVNGISADLEEIRTDLREMREKYADDLPRLVVADLNHLIGEIGIVIEHLTKPIELLGRGTVE